MDRMKLARDHMRSLDAGEDHRAYAAFTRLINEPEAPVHMGDLKPLILWLCEQLDEQDRRLRALETRQDANRFNPPDAAA